MSEIRVLLADDHGLLRKGVRSVLAEDPDIVVVGEAHDGPQAIRLAEELNPDVVIMDIAMPRLNGLEAATQIARESKRTGTLILSMYSDEEYLMRAVNGGVRGYLLKDSAEPSSPVRRSSSSSSYGSRIKELPDLLLQSSGRKRLLKKVDLPVHEPLWTCGVLAISRNVERLEARPFILQPPGQLPSVHPRHHNVGDEQMNPPIPSTRDNESFSAAAGLQHGVSPRPENPGRKLSHSCLIVRDEDGHTFTGPLCAEVNVINIPILVDAYWHGAFCG